jgi:regulator of sigma E protease
MQHLEDILWLLVLIGVMINIHELGHYLAARYFDVKIEAFSFGFGTRLFGFRRGETDFRFSAIPFGGYVKMAGETMGDLRTAEAGEQTGSEANDPRSFIAKPRWQRLIILFAGPFMNMVLAVSIPTVMYMYKYQRPSEVDLQANIGHVVPDSPAAKAGILDGDRIVKLDGKANPTWDDIIPKEETSAYREMHLTIERNGKRFDTTVTPVLSERSGVGYAGWDERGEVEIVSVEPGYPAEKAGLKKGDVLISVNGQPIHSRIRFTEITMKSEGKPMAIEYSRKGEKHTVTVYPVLAKLDGPPERYMIGVGPQSKWTWVTTRLSLPGALKASIEQNGTNAFYMVKVLESMVERRMSAKNLTGPIGLIKYSGEAARAGAAEYFGFMAMVSLQLAIFNLLPIPVLDGGSILMLLIEITMRRDLSMTVKETVFKVGFVCIMMLVAFVIFNDISYHL